MGPVVLLPQDSLQTRRWWVRAWLFLLFLLVAHTFIRCLLSKNLYYDEAEQLIFIQQLSLGYSPQPPLYSWLVWGMAQLVGANVVALALVQALLVCTLYLEMALLSRRLFPDRRAILAFLIPMLLPLFAWDAWRMTHTPLLCVLCLATVLAVLRLQRASTRSNYLLLGVCFGLGMLTKYNYAVIALACVSACLIQREYRSIILHPRFLVSLVVGCLIVLPHAWWALGSAGEIAHYYRDLKGAVGSGFTWWAGVKQIGKILLTLLAISSVPLVLLLLLAWRSGWKHSASTPLIRLLAMMVVIGLGCYFAILLVGRMQSFRHHWLAPFLLLIPLFILSRISSITLHPRAVQLYVGVAVIMSLSILGVRSSTLFFDYQQGKYETRDFLFADLAEVLEARGIRPEQVISGDVYSGGYARIYLNHSQVQCSNVLNQRPERSAQAVTLVLWDATLSDGCSALMPTAFQAWFKEHVSPEQMKHIVTSSRTFDTRMKRLGYCILMPQVDYRVMKPVLHEAGK